MTEEEFLNRCKTIYRNGHARPEVFVLMERWLDFVMRFEHTLFSHGQGQGPTVWSFLDMERERLHRVGSERGTAAAMTLANDPLGYELQQVAAILSHHCQKCAEDPRAWHTRSAFCSHKELR
jgi:hypothetical protein